MGCEARRAPTAELPLPLIENLCFWPLIPPYTLWFCFSAFDDLIWSDLWLRYMGFVIAHDLYTPPSGYA